MALNVRRYDSYSPATQNPVDIFPIGKLIVEVIKARHIKGDEFLGHGKADPYAIIALGGKDHGRTKRTPVIENAGSEPVWHHTAVFLVKSQHEEYDHFNVQIYNQNHSPRKDNVIGTLSMRGMCRLLTENSYAVEARWFPIHYKGGVRGEMCMSFSFIPMSAPKLLLQTEFDEDDHDSRHGHREVDRSQNPLIDWRATTKLITLGIGVAHGVAYTAPFLLAA